MYVDLVYKSKDWSLCAFGNQPSRARWNKDILWE